MLHDRGPNLEYNFLFFNLNTTVPAQSTEIARKRRSEVKFRQAISLAIDCDRITRLVYRGPHPPWTPVTPASKFWIDTAIPHPPLADQARKPPQSAGFYLTPNGTLIDCAGSPVEFSTAHQCFE